MTLGGNRRVQTADAGLITLPSGARRWERRALTHHATVEECKQLARLQEELKSDPTTEANLANRVRLAEIWYDLLDQEGLSFHWDSGTWLLQPGELYPWTARHQFNDALAALAFSIHFSGISVEFPPPGLPTAHPETFGKTRGFP